MDARTVTPPKRAIEGDRSPNDRVEPPLEEEFLVPLEGNDDFDDDNKALRYDPEMVSARYRKRPFRVWGRFLEIVWPFLLFFLSLWWDRRTGNVAKHEARRAIRLREILTDLGPAYIKIGQALSTRPDLVPPLYLDELGKLQDQLPPFPNKVAYRFIEEELGAPPDKIYAELSERPVAAASLGQVYKGKLKSGETVAVKVQRPDLLERVALDIYLLRTLAQIAQKSIKRLRSDLVAIMDEFASRIFEEMDYSHEARNAERFASLYGHIKGIYVPCIYEEYTRRRVLTMEWITGTKLTNLEAIREQNIDARHIIEVGVQCSLRQLLEHGFFHADPHPGNLLAMPDGRLAYLDFGMMSEVKRYQRYGLIEAVVHLVNRDFEGLAQDYVKLEFLTPDTDLRPIVPALSEVFNDALGASVAELNFKSITDQLSALMYEYPFRVPAYYALIIRSLVTLEGIAINVDPNFKVLSKAYPYVAKRLLTDSSPELRSSLRELLFKEGQFRWNRLENLLRNAKDSDDYDLANALNQALDFLFSERGEFIRDRLVDEVVKNVDLLSQDAVQNTNAALREWLNLSRNGSRPTRSVKMSQSESEDLERVKRIWEILQDTPGFDPMQLVRLVPGLLAKPETQQMGQEIVGNLAQRAAARLIRSVFLADEPKRNAPVRYSNKRALPPARSA
ncbi:AarF/ABC1/UbiB kinase family protein [Geitlerinema sp. CS-897]|nr:AarF/ABC1/UbiB kinase family protein [Geitlerinema sp. CS-897]